MPELLGSSLDAPGARRLETVSELATLGLQVGSGEMLNKKQWSCEDSLGLFELGDGEWLAVAADGHWGGRCAEFVVQNALALFVDTDPSLGRAQRVRTALRRIEAGWHESLEGGEERSETTALIVHLEGGHLSWASIGDSLVALASAAGWQLLNPLRMVFVGRKPVPESVLDAGSTVVEPGTVVLLATDGLEPRASQLDPREVVGLIHGDRPLAEHLRQLMERADDPNRGAGRDNLGVIALKPEC